MESKKERKSNTGKGGIKMTPYVKKLLGLLDKYPKQDILLITTGGYGIIAILRNPRAEELLLQAVKNEGYNINKYNLIRAWEMI